MKEASSKNKIWLFETEKTSTILKQSRSVKKKIIVFFFVKVNLSKQLRYKKN